MTKPHRSLTDPELLDYYTGELLYMRELAQEFAEQHPKVAKRLGMHAGETADPYVERLLQASSFVTARMRMRLDTAFPELMQPLLETVYPNYVRQTPSISVARLYPGHESGHLGQGFLIPRGTAFTSRPPEGEKTPCVFRSSQDVTVYPLRINLARVTLVPSDIPSLDFYVPDGQPVHGALRLTLETTNGTSIASLGELARLPVYLTGDERTASHLFELLHTSSVATVMAAPGRFTEGRLYGVTRGAVVHEGLDPQQAVLPDVPRSLHGHGLVQEYFACPARFWFFALTGLAQGLRAVEGNAIEIVILLNRAPGALLDAVDASHVALFCTPVINLFPWRTKHLEIDPEDSAPQRLVPVPDAPADFDLRSVDVAHGQVSEDDSDDVRFKPWDGSFEERDASAGHYFSLRRELCRNTGSERQYGTRRPFTETQTFISLVNGEGRSNESRIRSLSLDAWLTNRDLPSLLDCNGRDDLTLDGSKPVASVGLVRAPSAPKSPLARHDLAWQLMSQLNLNYGMFDDRCGDHDIEPHSGDGVRRRLRLYVTPDAGVLARQVECLLSATATPVNRKLPGDGPFVFGRCIECCFTFDESGFDGVSPYTLALVLEHYVARHVSTHSFTTTVLYSKQRGRIASWPPRRGTRGVF
ncbi:type VI secretion system baseplate subunit TssF [Paraburkholderia phytofirmans]|uniref:Type VI secretion protein, VC_A0110 family n=2 Tax=Paraburkholderia phytofirmans TaxID=261302 RepID=B2SZJ5_PARPJ|nr:type VI secretion system baseplate subunit TssF [Paraburkholderia phytofirmans]ACD17183.1 type VI secretion protein, VC_A0110 family [Paraburkholderia phytofirmans PsJN]